MGCNYQTLCLSFPSRTSEPLVGFAIINYRTSSNKRPGAYLKKTAKRRTAYWKEGASSRGRLFSWKLVEIQKNENEYFFLALKGTYKMQKLMNSAHFDVDSTDLYFPV